MDDKTRLLLDLARAQDAEARIVGARSEEGGMACSGGLDVWLFDENGNYINHGNLLPAARVAVAMPAELAGAGKLMGAYRTRVWIDGELAGSLDVEVGDRTSGARQLALVALAHELGVGAAGGRSTGCVSIDYLSLVARQQLREQAGRAEGALYRAAPVEDVLLDPAWFETADGGFDGGAYGEALREVAGDLSALYSPEDAEELWARRVSGDTRAAGERLDEFLAEEVEGLAPSRLEETLEGAVISDDAGRLIARNGEGTFELRAAPRGVEMADEARVAESWSLSRKLRFAEALGVTSPARAAQEREADRERSRAAERGRRFGAKEILCGDRVVAATTVDRENPVACDGQDAVEYNACDDDVLAGQARAFSRDSRDLDSDGVCDIVEEDRDGDGIADWAEGGPVAASRDDGWEL